MRPGFSGSFTDRGLSIAVFGNPAPVPHGKQGTTQGTRKPRGVREAALPVGAPVSNVLEPSS